MTWRPAQTLRSESRPSSARCGLRWQVFGSRSPGSRKARAASTPLMISFAKPPRCSRRRAGGSAHSYRTGTRGKADRQGTAARLRRGGAGKAQSRAGSHYFSAPPSGRTGAHSARRGQAPGADRSRGVATLRAGSPVYRQESRSRGGSHSAGAGKGGKRTITHDQPGRATGNRHRR